MGRAQADAENAGEDAYRGQNDAVVQRSDLTMDST